jgi:hypothetical protein
MNFTVKPITVAELIAHLQTLPQDLPVAYKLFSEQCLLELQDVKVVELSPVRPDGWIHNARPDTPSVTYLCFPGN